MGLPSAEHVLFIPGMLMIGIAIGYSMGARAARAELARRERERKK